MGKIKAFTLAEVLVTLGIIGVVAAMTIPTLMQKTQDVELKTAYKKEVSVISAAFALLVNDNGGTVQGAYDENSFADAIATKLSYVKKCTNSNDEGCWHKINTWYKTSGEKYSNEVNDPGLILKDGTLIYFVFINPNCDFDMTPYNGNYSRCGYIGFDINGFKKPNMIGKDILNFNILPNRLVIEGTNAVDSTKVCVTKDSNWEGWDCGINYLTGAK